MPVKCLCNIPEECQGIQRPANQLPVPLQYAKHIDVHQLIEKQAKWHKSCYLKFNHDKLEGQGRENEVRTQTVVLQVRDPVSSFVCYKIMCSNSSFVCYFMSLNSSFVG